MAFDDIGADSKQRINLSEKAISIIREDQIMFSNCNRSNFLNRIIKNMVFSAEASISLYLDREINEICAFSGLNIAEPSILKLKNKRRESLIKKYTSFPKGTSVLFRLCDSNNNFLTNPDSECHEEKNYARLSQYLKALLEEYVLYPSCKREIIYFKEYFENINIAINNCTQLLIEVSSGKKYLVTPYGIQTDQLNSFNYLIGYSRANIFEKDLNPNKKDMASFRMSTIKNITPRHSKDVLSHKEKESLKIEIKHKGVQFLSFEAHEVHVVLTEKGVQMYSRQLHLRPQYVRIENHNEYVFNCTFSQIEFYFFKFGQDAQIIYPAKLKESFRQKYREALLTYD